MQNNTLDKEINAVAASTENGTHSKQAHAAHASYRRERPMDSVLSGMLLLQLSINSLTDSFSALPRIRRGADSAKLKSTMRSFIDQLGGLYEQIP